MTSSNFVGCSMGRSAGLAPFRNLPTQMARIAKEWAFRASVPGLGRAVNRRLQGAACAAEDGGEIAGNRRMIPPCRASASMVCCQWLEEVMEILTFKGKTLTRS